MESRAYLGTVMHRRGAPHPYRFRHRVFSLLLDLDELDETNKTLRFFSRNRFNLISFHDRDFGARDGSSLREWAENLMRRSGITPEAGPIRLLCFPRVLGYGFNPLSVWYCHKKDQTLQAVILEVRNTFGEKHQYVIRCDDDGQINWPRQWSCDKNFHVSPFITEDAQYRFRFKAPGQQFLVRIEEDWPTEDRPKPSESDMEKGPNQGNNMLATWSGEAKPLRDITLLRLALQVPVLGIKIITLIHWHALKLWLRGVRFHSKPLPPPKEVSATCPQHKTPKY